MDRNFCRTLSMIILCFTALILINIPYVKDATNTTISNNIKAVIIQDISDNPLRCSASSVDRYLQDVHLPMPYDGLTTFNLGLLFGAIVGPCTALIEWCPHGPRASLVHIIPTITFTANAIAFGARKNTPDVQFREVIKSQIPDYVKGIMEGIGDTCFNSTTQKKEWTERIIEQAETDSVFYHIADKVTEATIILFWLFMVPAAVISDIKFGLAIRRIRSLPSDKIIKAEDADLFKGWLVNSLRIYRDAADWLRRNGWDQHDESKVKLQQVESKS